MWFVLQDSVLEETDSELDWPDERTMASWHREADRHHGKNSILDGVSSAMYPSQDHVAFPWPRYVDTNPPIVYLIWRTSLGVVFGMWTGCLHFDIWILFLQWLCCIVSMTTILEISIYNGRNSCVQYRVFVIQYRRFYDHYIHVTGLSVRHSCTNVCERLVQFSMWPMLSMGPTWEWTLRVWLAGCDKIWSHEILIIYYFVRGGIRRMCNITFLVRDHESQSSSIISMYAICMFNDGLNCGRYHGRHTTVPVNVQ